MMPEAVEVSPGVFEYQVWPLALNSILLAYYNHTIIMSSSTIEKMFEIYTIIGPKIHTLLLE